MVEPTGPTHLRSFIGMTCLFPWQSSESSEQFWCHTQHLKPVSCWTWWRRLWSVECLAAVPEVGHRRRTLRRPGKLAGARGAALSRIRLSAPGSHRGAFLKTTRSRGAGAGGRWRHCRWIRPQAAAPLNPEAARMELPLPVGAQPLVVSA